ncbi:stage II sporulation protein M [Pseudoduganella sp. DS3]|uniref:Stage II sporulation protein M n=1 Tax=Pseudoduganella guangdongensis TaxID=2692179 RepID=A0A6N9HH90_9BURK|nr:stage II sporulation protein M [Pseudoduganella guangdongensis]MYN02637.1 stage II sporulation protein M [Pseudoduganella guangdongensis]
MKQAQFETTYGPLWSAIETTLASRKEGREALPEQYRRLCQCLALASQRGYSPQLVSHLHDLVARCHHALYSVAAERPTVLLQWLRIDLPRRVRAEWKLLLLVLVCLLGPAIAIGLLVWHDARHAYLFAAPEDLARMHSMYSPSSIKTGRGGSEGDVQMFGHYIWNNVSIDFRTFASGIFGGVPALLIVLFNGLHMGVAAAWLSLDPATRTNFWSFVVTHSSFELAGLVLSGMAGIRLGLSLIKPGRLPRRDALQQASIQMYPLVAGAALLTVLAAFFEAFWSASDFAPAVKYSVGGVCWALVFLFFGFAGRGKGAHATR